MKAQKKLIKHDWNFDSDKVLDDELVAFCVWEYARESNSICGAVEIAKTAYANQGIARPESEGREAFRSRKTLVLARLIFRIMSERVFRASQTIGSGHCRNHGRADLMATELAEKV
jgi:hypothetical protein